jgi:hypothetical protein
MVKVSIAFLLFLLQSIALISSDVMPFFISDVYPFQRALSDIWLFNFGNDKSWDLGDISG